MHGVIGGEELGILGVTIASPPCLVEDGFGTGGIDEFVETECGFFKLIRKDGRGLALVLKNDKVIFAVFNFFGGFLFGQVEGEGFATGVDKGELGVGVRGRFDEVDNGLPNATGVAVADEEDFFWWRGGGRSGFRLSET